jgi:NitT/TauT family transport system ATP-binding protein
MLAIEKLTFSYGTHDVINQFNLFMSEGEIVSLIGASGCGKTTLFRLITGLETPKNGTICLDAPFTYMTQDTLLLPWRTVIQNLRLPSELTKTSPPTDETVANLLRELDMSGFEGRYPNELSGGQRQRVSLARALLEAKPLILMDEPFRALDLITKEKMFPLVRSARDRHDRSILIVTHDFHDAIELSDRILLLKNGAVQEEWIMTDSVRANKEGLRAELRSRLVDEASDLSIRN